MAELAVPLEPEAAAFVEREVAAGHYADAKSVVHAALDLLQHGGDAEAVKEARYRALVQAGLDSTARGETIEVENVRTWLDGLGRRHDSA